MGLSQPFGPLGGQGAGALGPLGGPRRRLMRPAVRLQSGFRLGEAGGDVLGAFLRLDQPGGVSGRRRLARLAGGARRRRLGLGEAQVHQQEAALDRPQPAFQGRMLFRPLGLTPQRLDAPDDLALDVPDAV